MKKYIVGTCAFNEGEKIKNVIRKYNDYECYDVVIVDDGSTDGSLVNFPLPGGVEILTNSSQQGAGYGVRRIFEYARARGYVAVFFVSGNDKDDPRDIDKLKGAIENGYDFVQGSRYLSGGRHGAMPFHRKIATRFVHPALFSLITGRIVTDSTNGFRAVRLSILDNEAIDLKQDWLNEYELEPYLFYKAIRLGYQFKEVPVTKIYPSKEEGYTKMKPFSGWWSILRPLVFLALGVKK